MLVYPCILGVLAYGVDDFKNKQLTDLTPIYICYMLIKSHELKFI